MVDEVLESMSGGENDQKKRRDYWMRSMDQGYEFMQKASDFPVAECGEPMAPLRAAAKEAGLEVTFSEKPHVGGRERMYYLREGLIESFLHVAREMNERGWVLHVEDAYRSRAIQRDLGRQDYTFEKILKQVLWELDGRVPDAGLMFRRVSALIATSPKIGTHMSGSAIDISVFRRNDRSELDRGGAYLEMSELTPMDSPFVAADATDNRKKITHILQQFGFMAYPYEFWHYSRGDAYDRLLRNDHNPARYGPIGFDPATDRISPIENPAEPLNSLGEIQDLISRFLAHTR